MSFCKSWNKYYSNQTNYNYRWNRFYSDFTITPIHDYDTYKIYVFILQAPSGSVRWKMDVYLHGSAGYCEWNSAVDYRSHSNRFVEPDSFDVLQPRAESGRHILTQFTTNNQAFSIGMSSQILEEWTPFDVYEYGADSDLPMAWYLFNNLEDYNNAIDLIRKNSVVDEEQIHGENITPTGTLNSAWIGEYTTINYVSEKRNASAYLSVNSDKAEMLVCYFDKKNIRIVPNLLEKIDCTYKIGATAIVNNPLWDNTPFASFEDYLSFYNFTTETIDINLTSNDYVENGSFIMPKLDVIYNDVVIELSNQYVVEKSKDNIIFEENNVRILKFNSESDFNKWRNGDSTIKFDEVDTDISPTPKDDDFNDVVDLNDITLPVSNMNRLYRLTGSQLQDLSNYLWNTDKTIYEELIKNLELMGANPLDAIISIRLYPFVIANFCNLVQGTSITIGRTNTGIGASRINSTTPKIHICDFKLSRNYNDFKDFEPYTSYKLYLPYAQMIDINMQGVYNVKISIDLIVDINTGMGEYVISYDNRPITYVNCKIGIDIPYSASQERINSSALLQSAMNVGVGALMGNEVGALIGGVKSAFEIRQNSNKFMNGGVGGSFVNLINPHNVYLIKYHTPYSEPTNYNFQHGYPYEKYNNINSLGGKVWVDNPIINDIPCTEIERNEIVNLLQNGVQLD